MMKPSEYLTVAAATRHRFLNRPSPNAIWRWMRRGLTARNGECVRLHHVRIGGRLYTRSEWIDEFLSALRDADAEHFDVKPHARGSRRPQQKQPDDHMRSYERLRKEGLV